MLRKACNRPPIDIQGALGCYLYLSDGKKVYDLTSGWNVVNLGWSNPTLVGCLSKQLAFPFKPNWCTDSLERILAEELLRVAPSRFCIPSCTGTEAIENSIKLARTYSKRDVVIGFQESYHGSTLSSAWSGGVSSIHQPQDLAGIHYHLALPEKGKYEVKDLETDLIRISEKGIPAAILIEPVFTNPGVIIPGQDFLKVIEAFCRKYDVCLIVDEIGTGFGRTGKFFGFEHFCIDPDIIAFGKAASSGFYPVSGVIAKEKYRDLAFGPAFDSTYAWTPYGCRAVIETIHIIQNEGIVHKSLELGKSAKDLLHTRLSRNPALVDVRGVGLEIAVQLDWNQNRLGISRERFQSDLIDLGLFVEFSRYTNSILVMPPLVSQELELSSVLDKLCDYVNRTVC